ncbi:nitronate monooxygenase family protein (plasmid) [Kovacikia minuta CCNUW1]|uniref:NAD(P)H-dependent flavin oxidoreductase n=1 Tax=Kovacikia minuta TaxID=2931930 RepID=UPI001CCFA105|nr:nitronate monooxygenase family protein [Kovacikia minuta]UBF30631.1 nitronate monooxygenase family protein [Kovacikia minuta CCNUW1]
MLRLAQSATLKEPLPTLRIGHHIAHYPIVQGAMAVRVSGANLVGAVANAGGVGVISSLGLGLNSPYFNVQIRRGNFFLANQLALIDELQKARALSPTGIIGVNILIATKDYPVTVRTAAENGANLIITAAGLPLDLPEYTANHPEVALVPMVCGLEAVQTICQTWHEKYDRLPDAFIVENSKAVGGHIGTTCEDFDSQIESLTPKIQSYLQHQLQVNIPLIAAGGIWDRSDVDRMLALGASGVQVGTRFITTEECDADRRYKEFHLHARPEDVVIIPSPVGKPARALRNTLAEKAIVASPNLERRCIANCLEHCLCRDSRKSYCILQALANAAHGDVENGLVFSGANVGRADRILSVAEVMAELTSVQEVAIA